MSTLSTSQNLVEELKLDFEKLKEFKPNLVSKGFSKLIEELCSDCRIFEPDPDLRDDFEISETQLINGLRKIFYRFKSIHKPIMWNEFKEV